jgi:hypothetical protein
MISFQYVRLQDSHGHLQQLDIILVNNYYRIIFQLSLRLHLMSNGSENIFQTFRLLKKNNLGHFHRYLLKDI